MCSGGPARLGQQALDSMGWGGVQMRAKGPPYIARSTDKYEKKGTPDVMALPLT